MKILHLITGLGNGGAEAVMTRLAVSDSKGHNEHYVVSLTDRGVYAESLESAGIVVHALNFPRGNLSIKGMIKLFKILKSVRPDVIQTWMYHADLIGGIAARAAGIKAVVWGIRHANFDPAHNSKGTLRVVRVCALLSRWVPEKIITCSEQAMRLHQAAGYRAEKFVHIPNGYSMVRFKPDAFARQSIRAELNVSASSFVLGMVARLDAQKDHKNLIEALSLIKKRGVRFTCILVGSGIEEGDNLLCEWIEKAGISGEIKLLGPRSDIPAVMNAVDVHVLSSLGEAFPNVLAEAMACGIPCVTTDVGDASVIVGKYGWVVASQDAEALADGLIKAHGIFSSDDEKWRKIKSLCRSHIMDNFDLELMCERYRQVWKVCVKVK